MGKIKEYKREWYQKNKKRLREKQREYRKSPKGILAIKKSRLKNKTHKKEQDRKYYLKNKTRLNAKHRAYMEAHPDKKLEINKRFYWKHKPELQAKRIEYRKSPKGREILQRYSAKYKATHKEQIKIANKQYFARPEVKIRKKQYEKVYQRKPERKEWVKRYKAKLEVNERYNALSRKYRRTEKGRATARYYNQRRREWKLGLNESFTRNEFMKLLKETKGICPSCKNPFSEGYHSKHELTIDHNPPVSKAPKGFVYYIENIKLLCRSCNSKKSNKV